MKVCSCCKEQKPLEDFYRKNHSNCKECHKKDTAKRRKIKHRERRDMLLTLKGRTCEHCRNVFPDCCYDLHHIDPSKKEFQFNQLYGHSVEKLIVEADKCILLCSNCHRIEHQRLRDLNK